MDAEILDSFSIKELIAYNYVTAAVVKPVNLDQHLIHLELDLL